MVLSACVLSGTLLLDSCKKPTEHLAPVVLPFNVPPGFPPVVYDFQQQPVTQEGFELGRKLFYDGRLSRNGLHSCASCHLPVAAFTTFEHDRSHGYNDSHTLRNAPGLFNMAWYPYFNQDGSALDLASLMEAHIQNPYEMADHLVSISKELSSETVYFLE